MKKRYTLNEVRFDFPTQLKKVNIPCEKSLYLSLHGTRIILSSLIVFFISIHANAQNDNVLQAHLHR